MNKHFYSMTAQNYSISLIRPVSSACIIPRFSNPVYSRFCSKATIHAP
jgi:hypothetical protein